MKSVGEALIRCLRIISSCNTAEQLESAEKYCQLMAWHIYPDEWSWKEIELRGIFFVSMCKQINIRKEMLEIVK